MDEKQSFFIFLLESYACEKKRPTGEVLKEWEDHDLIQYIFDNYLAYHTEPIQNAYADIDSMLESGKPAW